MAIIATEGSISFRKYFDLVLYHPEWGYYSHPKQSRTGKEGDFFTAVSVGPLFGQILAEYAFSSWERQGRPSIFRIVEWGAEQGDLAKDILAAGTGIGGCFGQALHYAVVEPLPQKRTAMAEGLENVEVVAEAAELGAQPGLVIANELIDALSFWLIRWEKGQWWEKRVTSAGNGLVFELAKPCAGLEGRLSIVAGRFEEGYESELRPSLADLLAEMKSVLTGGEVLLFDYGFERPDLYHPSRTTGTIRTYGSHQAGEDPLVTPGQIDITAHVDFTSLAEDARSVGLQPALLESQGHFLTQAATRLLTRMDGQVDPSFIRQFQTLTHPAYLGAKFSVFRATLGSE
ncbi:class I SAM-dependent methyltransferase [Roseibacillus persicicus]|nr:SAM-dependent methyltransferase [Roseibacillus persicicus]